MSPFPLNKTRLDISRKVRRLRTERGFTQTELAQMLELSQSRLSEIEQGKGSFTAEQLLIIVKLFNVPLGYFAASAVSVGDELQNSLAQLGSTNLAESTDVLPSDRLREVMAAVRETLVTADSPRQITTLGPVLVNHIDNLSLWKLRAQLAEVGLERRLGWTLHSILEALKTELERELPRSVKQRYRKAATAIDAFLGASVWPLVLGHDVLDKDIRSEPATRTALAERSQLAERWGLVTRLKTADFVDALKDAYEPR